MKKNKKKDLGKTKKLTNRAIGLRISFIKFIKRNGISSSHTNQR